MRVYDGVHGWYGVQVIYTLPELDPALEKEMMDAPYETKSDSYYFVGNKMVMHNKV